MKRKDGSKERFTSKVEMLKVDKPDLKRLQKLMGYNDDPNNNSLASKLLFFFSK